MAWRSGLADESDSLVPQRGEKRGLVDLANRNAALAYESRFIRATRRNTRRSRGCRRCWRCPRCRVGSNASTFRPFRAAKRSPRWSCVRTAACGGASIASSRSKGAPARRAISGMRRRPRVRQQRLCRDARSRRCGDTRKLLEHGGPFPDLMVIDGGKGQLSSAYSALRDVGPGEPGRGRDCRRRKSCSSRATTPIPLPWPSTIRRSC